MRKALAPLRPATILNKQSPGTWLYTTVQHQTRVEQTQILLNEDRNAVKKQVRAERADAEGPPMCTSKLLCIGLAACSIGLH